MPYSIVVWFCLSRFSCELTSGRAEELRLHLLRAERLRVSAGNSSTVIFPYVAGSELAVT